MNISIGQEIYIRRGDQTQLGVVTAATCESLYVLLSDGKTLIEVGECEVEPTEVFYKDISLIKTRQMTLDGKLKGWRNILPRKEWYIDAQM